MADQPMDQGEGALPRRRPGSGLAAVAVAVGLFGLTVSLAGLAIGISPRHFTAAEQQRIVSWEIGKRWHTWPAGRIFPAQIAYELPGATLASTTVVTLTARRAGIMQKESCTDATDAAVGEVLARYGCEAVLRATYSDAAGAFVTTVGVAVLADAKAGAAAHDALTRSGGAQPGILAVGLPGTLTTWFTDSGRQVSSSIVSGPYLVMYTAGYADGRPRETADANQYAGGELLRVSESIAGDIAARIGAPPPPPRCPGSPGC